MADRGRVGWIGLPGKGAHAAVLLRVTFADVREVNGALLFAK